LTPALKLTGFFVLLAVIFAGARLAGASVGPVTTTGHAHVQYTGGGGSGMGAMNMGSQP
jgi:hypothetical protein